MLLSIFCKKGTIVGKEGRRVTSTDVARASGVSRATVSYVLNNDSRQSISEETRARVHEAADKLGYRPFAAARILRSGHSQTVLAVLPFEQVDPSMARGLKDLEAELAAQGFSLICHVGLHRPSATHTHPATNLTPAVIASFADQSDRLVAKFLEQFDAPIVPMNNISFREAVGRAQVNYLFQAGQRRIVFAAPERRDVQKLAQARLAGVRQACVELGLEPPVVQEVPLSRQGVQEAIGQLLTDQSPPFGVCGYNDEIAFAVIAALSDVGIAIPGAVAVIGCDDIPLAQFSIPSLTTIRFDSQTLVTSRVENLLAAAKGQPVKEVPPVSMSIKVRRSA